MQTKCKKSGMRGVLVFLMLLFALGGVPMTAKNVQAAANGFVTEDGNTYYYVNGRKKTGWLTLDGKKYYFYKPSGAMAKGWVKDSKGRKRYFYKNTGIMATGWVKNSKGGKMYFDPATGLMTTGWQTDAETGRKRYFNTSTGIMATGWVINKSGNKRYFYGKTGYMATGLVKSGGKYRYFDPKTGYLTFGYVKSENGTRYFYSGTGYMATGWIKNSTGKYRYFDPVTGYYVTGTIIIDEFKCVFNSSGYLVSKESIVEFTRPKDERTIKNYLLGAIQPVGQALYVWGGGWTDSTLKGVSPEWKLWYDLQSGAYDYNYYRDLSVSTRSKGLDCSGFVGWAAYQVMQKTSGVGDGYTVVSGDVGSFYKGKGWGTIVTQSDLYADGYTLKAGDVGYNSGHTWIVIGQCEDKSVVIVHSTPNAGCQIAGTPTPDGKYQSQAIKLAEKYMKRYEGFNKFEYHTSSGNYIKNGNYLRWNFGTLADPDGYLQMTADQILEDMFHY